LFAALLVAGLVLRVIVQLAYRPALMIPDSIDYLARAQQLQPTSWHPLGYPLFLHVIGVFSDLTLVTVIQHLLVLMDSVLIYLLLLRFGLVPWLAALGTAPLLLDAFQLNVEQNILSESFFETGIVAAFVIVLWRTRPGAWRCTIAGLLLAMVSLTRFNGAILILCLLAYLLLRRVGWLRIVAMLLAFVLPIVAYAGWYKSVNGEFTISGLSGVFLYGRIVSWADCQGLKLPSYEKPLCPTKPPPERASPVYWIASPTSPARSLRPHDGRSANSILEHFDLTIIEHQPLDYLNHVMDDYVRQFLPTHTEPSGISENDSIFQIGYPGVDPMGVSKAEAIASMAAYFPGPAPGANIGLDRFLRGYQRVVYTWGPLIAACLITSLIAVLGVGPARRSRRRAECLALFSGGVLVVLFATAASLFGFRYELPELFLTPPAAALAVAMLWPRWRSERWAARDATDDAAAAPPPSGPSPVASEPVAAPLAGVAAGRSAFARWPFGQSGGRPAGVPAVP